MNNGQFSKRAEDISKNSSNPINDSLNCPKNKIYKPPRFAKEFIKLSSVRYVPTKIYTKQCLDNKCVSQRQKCPIPCSETDFSDVDCSNLIETPLIMEKK